MTITVQNTTKIVELNGVPARVWEGETSTGIKVHCYITRIAVEENEPRVDEFKKELQECAPPSVGVKSIPLRLIL
jgi:hypothetical protein